MNQVIASGPGIITSFHGEHWFLSNFFTGAPFEADGWPEITWPSREHWFQAAKAASQEQVHWVLTAPSPADAKARGRSLRLPWDWEQRKRTVMITGVLAQFGQHDPMRSLLEATSPKILVEGNHWGDTYWGAVPYKPGVPTAGMRVWAGDGTVSWAGQNWLGRILMMAREVLT